MGGRFVDTSSSPQNIRALWDTIHTLKTQLAAAQATITKHASTLTTLQTGLTQAQQQAQAALGSVITQQTPVLNPPGTAQPPPVTTPPPDPTSHPNSYDVVVQAKADLIAAGINLVGDCGAFEITKLVVWRLAAAGQTDVGVLTKTSGANCGGFADGIVCYKDGLIYDILIDAGGANTPQWSFAGTVDPTRWSPPQQPAI